MGRPVVPCPPQGHIGPLMAVEGVGDRLRRFRRGRGLSQERLGELAGVSQNYIAQLERGATAIPRDPTNLLLLAKALGVRLRDLAEPTGWYDGEEDDGEWEARFLADPTIPDEVKVSVMRWVELERRHPPAVERPNHAAS